MLAAPQRHHADARATDELGEALGVAAQVVGAVQRHPGVEIYLRHSGQGGMNPNPRQLLSTAVQRMAGLHPSLAGASTPAVMLGLVPSIQGKGRVAHPWTLGTSPRVTAEETGRSVLRFLHPLHFLAA